MPLATLLNCSSLTPSRVIRMPTGSEKIRLSRRDAAMRYITIGRPPPLPPDFLSRYPSHQRPSLSDIQELAGKGRLHMTDDDIVLLVHNPTPPLTTSAEPSSVGRAACLLNDEPIRIYVPCSCALGSCKLSIRRLLATLAPRAHCACWSGFTGGSA